MFNNLDLSTTYRKVTFSSLTSTCNLSPLFIKYLYKILICISMFDSVTYALYIFTNVFPFINFHLPLLSK